MTWVRRLKRFARSDGFGMLLLVFGAGLIAAGAWLIWAGPVEAKALGGGVILLALAVMWMLYNELRGTKR